ncbi:uncharacterized protein MYCFIDRAFT_180079 [Pseudocercospora fijiensis CIRAD86]|uniref:Uncharacterized protein n=1 Tax=Pseudocercospora fijiensis (strain CIRAD86) TaxID=383855 RepID=M3AI98_PSEFD|nr:uncharacterized protein MYCFIDRAFT_180079 [Pseudocercospora fijiensis CIRAD86]EME77202.1 hypothetical protein MYCFIDRAFT_180079 [Pseudocercospora fijiensis CIRAD86]
MLLKRAVSAPNGFSDVFLDRSTLACIAIRNLAEAATCGREAPALYVSCTNGLRFEGWRPETANSPLIILLVRVGMKDLAQCTQCFQIVGTVGPWWLRTFGEFPGRDPCRCGQLGCSRSLRSVVMMIADRMRRHWCALPVRSTISASEIQDLALSEWSTNTDASEPTTHGRDGWREIPDSIHSRHFFIGWARDAVACISRNWMQKVISNLNRAKVDASFPESRTRSTMPQVIDYIKNNFPAPQVAIVGVLDRIRPEDINEGLREWWKQIVGDHMSREPRDFDHDNTRYPVLMMAATTGWSNGPEEDLKWVNIFGMLKKGLSRKNYENSG